MGRIEEMLAGIGDEVHHVDAELLKDGLSPRLDGLNSAHVRHLAELEQDLPPLVVHRQTMRVVDGAHRLAAARTLGVRQIPVVYFEGSDDDAFLLAVRLNVVHGKALRVRDRTAAVQRILDGHPHWSDRWIASVCGVAPRTVAAVRKSSTDDEHHLNTRLGRDGRCHPLSIQERRRAAEDIMREQPGISLRQAALLAGISTGTALDVRRRLLASDPGETAGPQGGAKARAAQRWGTRKDAEHSGSVRDHLEWLTRDPSLRYTDQGRALLRLVSMTTALLGQSSPVAKTVPGHCRRSLETVARSCARGWRDFAERLASAEDSEYAEGHTRQPGGSTSRVA
jgi:ParB-like chromosome segregation protein Spo0J